MVLTFVSALHNSGGFVGLKLSWDVTFCTDTYTDQPIFCLTKQVGHGNQKMVSVTKTDLMLIELEIGAS